MYYNFWRIYRDPDGPRKKNESPKPPKGLIREYEGAEFIPYKYNLKGNK